MNGICRITHYELRIMNSLTVQGIVISSMPIGEYDRRVEILTGDLGRISAFARGARKPSSPLVSVCRPFAFGEFKLFQGKSSYSLSSARIDSYFEELAGDIVLTYYGFYFLELAKYFCREGERAKEELKLLYVSLRSLISEKFDNRLVRAVYEQKLLYCQGLCPPSDYVRSYRDMSAGARYTYDFVINTPPEKLFTFKLKEEILEEYADISAELIRLITDKEFNSLNLLETLTKVD